MSVLSPARPAKRRTDDAVGLTPAPRDSWAAVRSAAHRHPEEAGTMVTAAVLNGDAKLRRYGADFLVNVVRRQDVSSKPNAMMTPAQAAADVAALLTRNNSWGTKARGAAAALQLFPPQKAFHLIRHPESYLGAAADMLKSKLGGSIHA